MKNQIKGRRSFLSKMFIAGASSIALLSTSAYAGRGGGGKGSGNKSTSTSLTEVQKDKLFFIYQEEKLARDVYITLGQQYPNENTFASIQLSEQRHIDAAQNLCDKYGIDISEVNEDGVGNFVLQVIQDYYDALVAEGSVNLTAALGVGVFVEELDIHDLDEAIELFDGVDDVVRVYENLREGSYNHLEAFNTALAS